jgi:hypothetical protein
MREDRLSLLKNTIGLLACGLCALVTTAWLAVLL